MNDTKARIQSVLGNKYQIDYLIKSGGMGKVFLGIHKALGKKVAIKIVHQELVTNEEIKSRFYREAKLSAGLDHSGIIKINDFGSHEDFDYIIMPYISGGNLQDRIRETAPMDNRDALAIIREIAEALDYAHSKHVVHRDIKPANIMFNEQGRVVITDFGISKNMDNSELTLPNTVLGSPKYMSPEQIKGDTVDARSDLYSLGIIFYEMLTGNHPYKGKDRTTIYYCQVHEIPPRPETIEMMIPAPLAGIIMKLLEKSPEKRYTSGLALIKDLDNFEAGRPISADLIDPDAVVPDEDATILDDEATLIDSDTPALDDQTRVSGQVPADKGFRTAAPDPSVSTEKLSMSRLAGLVKKHPLKMSAVAIPVFLLLIVLITFSVVSKDKEAETATTEPGVLQKKANGSGTQQIPPTPPDSDPETTEPPPAPQTVASQTITQTPAAESSLEQPDPAPTPASAELPAALELTVPTDLPSSTELPVEPPASEPPKLPAVTELPELSVPSDLPDLSALPPATISDQTADKASSVPMTLSDEIFSAGSHRTAGSFSVWTNQETYRIGDRISYHFKSEEPCYAIILGLTTQGQILQIFPNYFQSSQFIMADREYAIPDETMGFSLEVTGPAGYDRMVAFVYDTPFQLFDKEFSQDNPFLFLENLNGPEASRIRKNLAQIKNGDLKNRNLTYRIESN